MSGNGITTCYSCWISKARLNKKLFKLILEESGTIDVNAVARLLDAGADLNAILTNDILDKQIKSQSYIGLTAAHIAAIRLPIDIVNLVMFYNPNTEGMLHKIALFRRHRCRETISFLVDNYKLDIHQQYKQRSVLDAALDNGREISSKISYLFLDEHVSVNKTSQEKILAFARTDILGLYILHECSKRRFNITTSEQGNCLHYMAGMKCQAGYLVNVLKVIDEIDPSFLKNNVNAVDKNGDTPLSVYIKQADHLPLWNLKILVFAGCDLPPVDENGKSVLHHAAEKRNGAVEILLNYKTAELDVNGADNQGNTPLMYAAYAGKVKNFRYLYNAGANLQQKNLEGKSVKDFVREQQKISKMQKMIDFMTSEDASCSQSSLSIS